MFSIEQSYSFSFPTDIRFGVGIRKEIPSILQGHGLRRPIVVTDKGLHNHPMVHALCDSLTSRNLSPALFADFSGNPVESHVEQGNQAFRKHDADCVVAIGGGAALDVAKAIALMSAHEGSILDYCEGPEQRAVTQPLPFLVTIPTTSGTGSEVGRSTVISDEKTHEKKVIFHPSLLARVVIVDPELTLDMPASITAATGMDALSHLAESILAKDFHPICDAIALHGLTILNAHFKNCYRIAKGDRSENSLVARGSMMLAAMMGAIAFQKGLGVTHSCAHALSSVCNTHHGLANGVMLPYAMTFNAQKVPEKFVAMAAALGLPGHDAKQVLDWMKQLQIDVEIPQRLSQIGVSKDQVNALADFAIKDGCHLSNPVPVTRDDFVRIFESAL